MKKIIFSFVFISYFLPVCSQTVVTNQVIGKVYTAQHLNKLNEFKNYKELDGVIPLKPLKTGDVFTKISDGTNTMVLFTQYVAPKSNKILAVLNIGKVDGNVMVGMARCRLNTKDDGGIVALVKRTGGKYLKNAIKAWRVDEKNHKFIAIPVNGIDCENDKGEGL